MKNQIRVLRKQKGMTQQELAKILGVSRQTVIAIENGKYHPSLELAFRIGRVMELPLEVIFFDQEDDDE